MSINSYYVKWIIYWKGCLILIILLLSNCSGIPISNTEVPGSNTNTGLPDNLLGSWVVNIEDLQHKVITTLTIHFSEKEADSCLGGDWKEVIIDSYKTSDNEFFPIDAQLSYQIDEDKFAIGRNRICDAYLQLNGKLKESLVVGEYIAFSWGSREKLGYFVLKRAN